MTNEKDKLVTWVQLNNLVPIIFTVVSVTLSVALFWYQIKLEITEIKGEQKLTNQKLDQLAETLGQKFVTVDTNTREINNLANRLTSLESQQNALHHKK